jgi:hypothetical protein
MMSETLKEAKPSGEAFQIFCRALADVGPATAIGDAYDYDVAPLIAERDALKARVVELKKDLDIARAENDAHETQDSVIIQNYFDMGRELGIVGSPFEAMVALRQRAEAAETSLAASRRQVEGLKEALNSFVASKNYSGDNVYRGWKVVGTPGLMDAFDKARAALASIDAPQPDMRDAVKTNEDELRKQCAHFGGLPARCLLDERTWSPCVVPIPCDKCPNRAALSTLDAPQMDPRDAAKPSDFVFTPPLAVDYTNWRGERRERNIYPVRSFFGSNEWHKEPQWLLEAIDPEDGKTKTFAFAGMLRELAPDPRDAIIAEAVEVMRQLSSYACDCLGRCEEFEWAPADNGLCTRWKLRAARAFVEKHAAREMTGLFAQLTDEQKAAALAYNGPENVGTPSPLKVGTPKPFDEMTEAELLAGLDELIEPAPVNLHSMLTSEQIDEALAANPLPEELARPEEESGPDILARLGDDASKWAAEFRKMAIKLGYSDMDEGWLIGWFANAIEHSSSIRTMHAKELARPVTEEDVEQAALRSIGLDPADRGSSQSYTLGERQKEMMRAALEAFLAGRAKR